MRGDEITTAEEAGMPFESPLSGEAPREERRERYERLREQLEALLEGEQDWTAAMATVACELHRAFEYYDWTGFYRQVEPELLIVGPYQGPHGCLRIPFSKGICGAAARGGETQLVDDVTERDDHIACSSTTRSEIVVPIRTSEGRLLAVLDVDSDIPSAFGAIDRRHLEQLAELLGRRYGGAFTLD